MKHPLIFYASCLLLSLFGSLPTNAQVSFETKTAPGLWRLTLEPTKTTFIGAYGQFVAPEVSRAWKAFWSGTPSVATNSIAPSPGKPKPRPSLASILLPNGRLPKDLEICYCSTTGWAGALMFEPAGLRLWNGLSPRLTVSAIYDANYARAFAPRGIGVFIDPTSGTAKAQLQTFGGELSLPLLSVVNGGEMYALYIGHGWMAERSTTYGAVNSAFLQLSMTVVQTHVIPTYSITFEYRPKTDMLSKFDITDKLQFTGLDLALIALKTEYMWTAGANASLIWSLNP